VSSIRFPEAHQLERLGKNHSRQSFTSGQTQVDDWLRAKALQNQRKHLSVTKVLVDGSRTIAGYYTLATGQVDFVICRRI